jgi:hypothetical protein
MSQEDLEVLTEEVVEEEQVVSEDECIQVKKPVKKPIYKKKEPNNLEKEISVPILNWCAKARVKKTNCKL